MHRTQIERARTETIDRVPVDFEAVVREHYAVVWRLVFRIVHNDEDAGRLVEQTFRSARAALSQLDSQTHVGTWLRRIAVGHALRLVAPAGRPCRRQLTEQCFLGLDGPMRTAVALKLEGATYEEISRILGIHMTTVRRRLLNARTALLKSVHRKRAALA